MFKRLIFVVLLLGVTFGGIFGWKMYQMGQAGMSRMAPPPATVAVIAVRVDAWQPRLHAIGTVTAVQGIYVTNEVPGIVDEILFESGKAVKQGAVLVRLEDSVDQADLRGLLAERDLATIKYERLAKLVRDRSASRSELDEAKAQLDNAEAQVAAKRALIAKKTITAPFDGRLGIRAVNLGEYLAPGSQLVPLQALHPIYVDFALPERHLQDLAIRQDVAVRATARPGQAFTGQVSAINTGVEIATRTIRVRATLPNSDGQLRPGMFADVEVLLPARDQVLTIPRTAITYAPYGDSVFVVTEQDGQLQVQRKQVSTGAVNGERVEVAAGLEAGERVVLAGQVKLRNGQAITIDNTVVPSEGEGEGQP